MKTVTIASLSPWRQPSKTFGDYVPHGQSTWHSTQKVGKYRAYINQYMVAVPSTFTLVYMGNGRTNKVIGNFYYTVQNG